MNQNQQDNNRQIQPTDVNGDSEFPILTDADLEAFREALPDMYRRFPEIQRLRPEQFTPDDPVREIFERFLAEQARSISEEAR